MKKWMLFFIVTMLFLSSGISLAKTSREVRELKGPVKEVVIINGESRVTSFYSLSGYETKSTVKSSKIYAETLYDEKGRGIQTKFDSFTTFTTYDDKKMKFQKKIRGLVDEYGDLDKNGNTLVTYKVMFDGKGPTMAWHGAEYDEAGNQTAWILYKSKVTSIEEKRVTVFDSNNRAIYDETVVEKGKAIVNPIKRYYVYDSNGFFEKYVVENSQGERVETEESPYKYTYEDLDSHGNWKKRIYTNLKTGEKRETIREISYYEE